MDIDNRTLRNGALVILAAVLLRILCSCTMGGVFDLFAQPELAAFLTDTAQTSPVETAPPTKNQTALSEDATTEPVTKTTDDAQVTEDTESTETTELTVPSLELSMTEADSAYVQLKYSCSREPDIPALINEPLQWDLTSEEPSVLIIHTHGTEAFMPTEGMEYEEDGGDFRTTNEKVNMISIGEELTRLLQAAGINVIHDRNYYDFPDYEASYDICRVALEEHLKQTPSIQLVIDLHRDAAEYEDGTQWATSATINGQESAQVMLVMGTDCYYEHPNWEKNLSVALKLHALMEKEHPGSTRPLDLRKQRFNQDLSVGAIIAEIGSAGNTHEQAMSGVSVLAEAIIRLSKGAA